MAKYNIILSGSFAPITVEASEIKHITPLGSVPPRIILYRDGLVVADVPTSAAIIEVN